MAQAQTPTFLARTDYYENAASKTAIGDFNGDGILDIVIDTPAPTLFLGNGDGTFRPGPANTVLLGDEGLVVADLNGDGKLDLVVSGDNGSIQVGYGNGDGTFQAGPLISLPGIVAVNLSLADVNGDGLPDLVAGSVGLLVFLNQGGGVFGPYTTLLPGDEVLATAVGDINGDGIADIVVGTGNGAEVLLGTGGGNFQNGQIIRLQSTAGYLVLADINGDGQLDLVATGDPLFVSWSEVSVLLGNGDGTFSRHTNVSIPSGSYGVLVGDMNGDGYPDLVILDGAEYPVTVAFNRGDAVFSPVESFASAGEALSFAIGPLRKPGLMDMVVTGTFSSFLSVLLNEGHGTFEDGSHIAMSAPPGPFAAADFNSDGLTDFAVLTSSGVSIYENSGKGDGPFTLIETYALASPNFIVTADFNKDGHPDLAIPLSGGGIAILLGQGGGRFAAPVTVPSGASSMIAIGDFNGDGNMDIAATSNQIFFGNGDGTFAAPQPLLAGDFFNKEPLAWLTPIYANLKNNRHLDLAVLTSYSNYDYFAVLINEGKGSFRLNTTTVAHGGIPSEVAEADFNGDGIPDLILSGYGDQVALLGNGDGTFALQQSVDCPLCFIPGANVVTGDFNGDGKADFAVTTGTNVAVFLGNGDATFQNPFLIGTAPGSGFLEYVELQKTLLGPRFAFVASSGDGVDIEIQVTQ